MFLVEQIVIYSLFAIALIANLWAEARESEIGKFYTKPLLIPLVLVFYLIMSRETNTFIVLALSFALLGDICLLFEFSNTAFRFGIVSFLCSHLCWILFVVFSLRLNGIPLAHLLWPIIPAFIPAIAGSFFIWKYLKSIRYLATLYMFAGSLLLYFCLLRLGYVPQGKAWHAITGCVFYFASDFMIVWSRFKSDFKCSGVYIMVTYISAVIYLVIGFMEPLIR